MAPQMGWVETARADLKKCGRELLPLGPGEVATDLLRLVTDLTLQFGTPAPSGLRL